MNFRGIHIPRRICPTPKSRTSGTRTISPLSTDTGATGPQSVGIRGALFRGFRTISVRFRRFQAFPKATDLGSVHVGIRLRRIAGWLITSISCAVIALHCGRGRNCCSVQRIRQCPAIKNRPRKFWTYFWVKLTGNHLWWPQKCLIDLFWSEKSRNVWLDEEKTKQRCWLQ